MKKILLTLAILCSFSFNNFAQSITHYVNSGNYYYSPSSLTINEGDTVVWTNDGGFHNVNADINTLTGLSFNNPVAFLSSPTSNTTLHTFIFTVPGTYNYDCSVGSHASNGMVGSLIVNALPIPGCTDPLALNYDANATIDDGSCIYPSNSIYDIVANSNDHNTLELAIDTCGLTATLQGAGTFTLFAPTDAAFNALPQGTIVALLNDLPQLTDILKHHVVGDSVMSGMLSNNQIVTTLLGTDVTVTINSNGVFIDNAQVIVADIVADNGVVHVIDAVLLPPPPSTNSVYDIVANSTDHNILEFAIDTCGLTTTLKGAGPFTLFAPTDVAFNALGQATILQLIADLPTLTNILKHHVVGDSVVSGMLSNNQIVTTLLGDDVTVTINTNGDVFIDNAQVIVADIVADNGVVHVIDAVLIPTTPANNTVYDIIDLSPSHTTLKTAIDACGLDGTLKGAGPFTVFAPTDAAFNALPAGTIAALLNDLPQLTDILKHHVVGANVLSGSLSNNQIVTTLLGTDVTVTINSNGDVFIDNAQVIVADIVADNGVVHVIDAVLLPASTLVSEINELNNKYLHSVNILGEKISRDVKNQIVLDIYSNGNIIKRFTR